MADAAGESDYRSVQFWNGRYQSGHPSWEIGGPAPPLVAWATKERERGQLAVLGCGRGEDALFFAQEGWRVSGFDFSDAAIQGARQNAASRGLILDLLQRDIFTLEDAFTGQFDVVVEHTCFCAIDPQRRDEYVQAVRRLLKPGGRFVGLFYAILPEDGPPFPTSAEELRRRFSLGFVEETLFVPENSHESRQSRELFGVFRRR
jgi:SAM-dependent methyltransferase